VIQDGLNEHFLSQMPDLKDRPEELVYKEMFRMFDAARTGFIPLDEMKNFFSKIQAQTQMTDEEVEMLTKDIDKNDDSKVDFSEFYKFMLKE